MAPLALIVLLVMSAGDSRDIPVGMNQGTLQLLNEIQQLYGRPVRFLSQDLDSLTWARAEIGSDGTPTVILNAQSNGGEADIAHELWHLKQTTQGVPARQWKYFSDGESKMYPEFLRLCDAMLLDSILHSLFYDDLRRRGLDPDEKDRAALEKLLSTKLSPNESYPLLPLTWVSNALTTKDGRLLERLREWFAENGALSAWRIGDAIVSHIRSSSLTTPEQIINVYVESLNILVSGRSAAFRVGSWSQEQLGSITRRIVTIEQFK